MNHDIRRVVVGVHGSANSLTALRRAAEEALCRDAELVPLCIYTSPRGEYLDLLWPPVMPESRLLHDHYQGALTDACSRVLADLPDSLRCAPMVADGVAAPMLVQATNAEDMLVVGGRPGLLHRALHGSVARYCLRHSPAPVVKVPPVEPGREPWAGNDVAPFRTFAERPLAQEPQSHDGVFPRSSRAAGAPRR